MANQWQGSSKVAHLEFQRGLLQLPLFSISVEGYARLMLSDALKLPFGVQEAVDMRSQADFALERGFADLVLACLANSQSARHKEFAEQVGSDHLNWSGCTSDCMWKDQLCIVGRHCHVSRSMMTIHQFTELRSASLAGQARG